MKETLNAVLAGCGGISNTWLDAAKTMEGLQVVGLVDLNVQTARAKADEYDLKEIPVSNDLESMLKQTRPDVFFDCTIPSAHIQATQTAFRYGCHVLSEKPIANSLDEAQQLIAAAEANNRVYVITEDRRFTPEIRSIRKFIDSGAIGALTMISTDFFKGAHYDGFRAQMEHPLLLDFAIHIFDVVRYITDAEPTSVFCHEWNPSNSWYDHNAAATAIFELSNNAIFNFRGSWCSEGFDTTWNSDWRITGEKGTIHWNGKEPPTAQIVKSVPGFYAEFDTVEVPLTPLQRIRHAAIMHDFIDYIRTGSGYLETTATDNLRTSAMVYSAVESSQLRQPVKMSL